jgi:hypothetical protein
MFRVKPDFGAILMAQTELGGVQEITLHDAGATDQACTPKPIVPAWSY